MKISLPENNSLPKLHRIQWQILKKMSTDTESRFNEIKPAIMDPRRFTFHLNRLKNLELVRHDTDKGVYLLTEKAKILIAYFTDIPSWGNLPLHSAILLYIEKGGKILVVKRDSQPFLGYTGLPYFLTKQDEFIHQSANKCLTSLGLTGQLTLPLIIEFLFKNPKEVIRHAFMLTYHCSNPSGVIKESSYEGKLSWMEPEELLKVELGYDNSFDAINFFKENNNPNGATVISKVYHTPM